ncbi:MAG: rhodanese-like domain-containing protein [Verrucomicrobiales bacterium]|nr:rhodanese-like domain-containing protein [Verrucomicrobiales bacterium]
MSRKGIITVALLFLVAFLLLQLATRGYREVEALQSMEKAMAAVRRDFPGAKPVSTAQLAAWIGEEEGVVLIDARATEEFAVSRIPGARRATTVKEASTMALGSKRVVIYDAVGLYSAELADALVAGGSEATSYLEGGIFQWANEGRPLVDADGKTTTKVHPYNKYWGRLLERK